MSKKTGNMVKRKLKNVVRRVEVRESNQNFLEMTCIIVCIESLVKNSWLLQVRLLKFYCLISNSVFVRDLRPLCEPGSISGPFCKRSFVEKSI